MSRVRVGINGFGRMGRLALRAAWGRDDMEFVAINEPHGSPETLATLLEFDSVQGRFAETCSATNVELRYGAQALALTRFEDPSEIPWDELGVDLVLECSGEFRTRETAGQHLGGSVRRVVVSAPVTGGPPNVVIGVNDDQPGLAQQPIVTAASCTTNCLAPVVRVLHDAVGIVRGLVTTIHDPTNTQSVHDAPHRDPRRARASMLSLIPTSTNSATAVTEIVPELRGKLDSIAVRAPVLNASICDCVFQVARDVTTDEINGIFERASQSDRLSGILGYETRPLVSADYARDPRSGIVDALSTRVTDGRLVKVLAWYDNEWGYANRLIDLAARVAVS